jgi:ABC-2 type transport system permease protein
MRDLAAGAQLQLALLRRSPGDLTILATVPLFALIFLVLVRNSGRADLVPYAVLAPAVIGIIWMAIITSGEVVDTDRHSGALELSLATRATLPHTIFGRIAAITVISSVAILESWLVAFLVTGVAVPIEHITLFAVTMAATVFATAGAATIMSALFVLARTARAFQNSLSYPLFLLGGALVPVSTLPEWVQPVARLIYLSWATDLLRDTLTEGPVPYAGPRIALVVALGVMSYGIGYALINQVVRRMRRTGRVGFA